MQLSGSEQRRAGKFGATEGTLTSLAIFFECFI